MEIKRIDKEKIKKELKEKGYVYKLIEYKELQELYKQYGQEMEEYDFAQMILGISYANYLSMKKKNTKAIILKSEREKISQEQIKKVRKELKEKGYQSKLISYEELKKLHQEYAKEVLEEDFAKIILDILPRSYNACKKEKRRVKILKSEEIKLSKKEIKEIKEELIIKGYENKKITYEEFQKLHQEYGKEVSESYFAQEVLNIQYTNYNNYKNRGGRVTVLEKKQKLSEEEIQKIKEELKKKGYENKLITYDELKKLHQEYAKEVKEKYFAQEVLGISTDSYEKVKYDKIETKVLKFKNVKLSEEEIEKIKEELKEKGYKNKKITYEELQKLHQEYAKEMKESDFAQKVLNIEYSNYNHCKNKRVKPIILKENKIELSAEEIEKIKEELKEKGYKNKKITYEELQKLHQEYAKEMKESDFAQIVLNIGYSNYSNCKNRGTNVKILKQDNQLLEEEVVRIKEELKIRGYENKLISYEELKDLHQEYAKEILEVDFAKEILEIPIQNYRNCKSKNRRTLALKKESTILREEIEKIKEELKIRGYENKLITYDELKKLHQEYAKEMLEVDFAKTVLDIKYGKFNICKKGGNVLILKKERIIVKEKEEKENIKTRLELPEEEIKKIVEEIKEKGYIGRNITYDKFQKIYQDYADKMIEIEFAQRVLGISEKGYYAFKKGKIAAIVKDGLVTEKAKEIQRLYINKPDYYSKEYINKICKEYEMTIEEFFSYVITKKVNLLDGPIKTLEKKGKYWIGKIGLTKEFADKNIELIIKIATVISCSVCAKYNVMQKKEDYIQDTILYIIQNAGAEEKNFGDNEKIFTRIVYKKAIKYCNGRVADNLKIDLNHNSFFRFNRTKDNEEYEINIEDKNVNIEQEIIQKEKREEAAKEATKEGAQLCINTLSNYIELGYKKEEAIQMTAEDMNIDPYKMLEYMKYYLSTKGKVKIRKSGEAELTDR